MDELLAGMRAIAETTRLRLLFILSHGEFNVSELTQILGQSQPRVSRHLKLMAEAGLLSRYKEGSWVLFRLREQAPGGALARAIVDLLPASDTPLASDIAPLEAIRPPATAARAGRAISHGLKKPAASARRPLPPTSGPTPKTGKSCAPSMSAKRMSR